MRSNPQLAADALAIFRAGLAAAEPARAVRDCVTRAGSTLTVAAPDGEVSTHDLDELSRVLVVGAGKASARMAQAVEALVPELAGGLVVVKYDHGAPLDTVEIVEAGHPVPDAAGRGGAERIVELLDGADASTLVISLISGGGSALLPLPAEGITLEEKRLVTDLLLAAGADIGEMNAVRKHVSAVKGGQLARRAYPAAVANLMLSDVIGDRLDVIASGPFVPDASSFAEAREVLERYELRDRVPASVRARIDAGCRGEIPENPRAGDPVFGRVSNAVIAGNGVALAACAAEATARGYGARVVSATLDGEAREVARQHVALARRVRADGAPIAPPACLIAGGETTVTLRGKGRGGRNQELALAAAIELEGTEGVAILSGGTDGTDGPTDAAGGLVFADSAARMRASGGDPAVHLEDNDSYPILDAVGDLVRTGPTGTNVMDIHLILISD